MNKFFFIFASIFFLLSASWAGDDDTVIESSDDGLRIENEYKLSLPLQDAEAVWSYLVNRYQSDQSFLHKVNPHFKVSVSEENFTDRYFDTSDLKLLKSASSVRHRIRYTPQDLENRKNGRNLVQMKLNLNGDINNLSRGELKFKVDEDLPDTSQAPLVLLVKKKYRDSFFERLKKHGLSISSLNEKLVLKQRRRRVYIELSGRPFSTITLDEAVVSKLWAKKQFTEIEIELNEINFTRSTPEERESMAKVSASIKDDLVSQFPSIKQDQTPKYNKAFAALSETGPLMKFMMRFF